MKNILKKSIFVVLACFLASSIFADTKTFTFDENVALETEWTVTKNVPSGGNGTCEIASPSKFTEKNGKYLLFSFENKSGITITITSVESFSSISNIYFDAVANDNSKPDFTLNIVDDSGNVLKNLYSNKGSKDYFATGGTNKWGKSDEAVNPVVNGHIQLTLYASSSGKYAAIDNLTVTYTGGPSTDASLKSFSYNGTTVTSGIIDNGSYSVELPAGTTTPPTVTAEANDSKATVNVEQATALPGTATITIIAEDGTTTQTHTVTFTVESAAPLVQTATWPNIKGTASIDQVTRTITGQVTNGSSLNLTPTFTGKNVASWTPTTADFSSGPVNITFSSSTSETTVYAVTITEADPVSTDATLKSLKYGSNSVTLVSGQLEYSVEVDASAGVPTVTAEPNDSKAQSCVITQAPSVPGFATIVVTAEDGETTLTYKLNFTVAVPGTDLTLHVPEIYEAKEIAGGYNGTLRVFGGREFEVYYAGKDNESQMTVGVVPTQKLAGIAVDKTGTSCKAPDGWFTAATTSISNYDNPEIQEFMAGTGAVHKMQGCSYVMHIKGFDQFSIYAADKNVEIKDGAFRKNQRFQIFIDNIMQPETQCSTDATVRRYDLTTGEHVIEVKALADGASMFYGFSLRLAQEPRTRWLKGNDSTQTVLATTAIKPIYYFTKYNSLGETKLVWDGETPDGISLTTVASGPIGDTLMISGVANCVFGTYNYHVSSLYNGVETSRVDGKINVIYQIKALTDTIVEAYVGEEMDEIRFHTYLVNKSFKFTYDTWPDGIDWHFDANTNILSLSGTPTQQGTYNIEVIAIGGNTINVKIVVKTLDLGNNPVLYLYKNSLAYEHDGVYNYLTSTDGGGRNLIARKTKTDGPRPADQYAKYKWILISEDADADNPEVLAAARGETGLPVLNMKAFSYSPNRLDWGEPDNGSLTNENGRFITIQRADHPIFQSLNKKQGDRIQVLDTVIQRGLMPTAIDYDGTLCLATAWTRDIEDYNGDGIQETFLHEIPASMRNGKKYICMPIAKASSERLTNDGKKFVKAVVNYLLSGDATVSVPELKITSFKINGVAGTIDQDNNTIDISLDITQYPSLDLTAVVPEVTVASPQTHVTPLQGETVDFSKSSFKPVVFEVSDYINRRAYDVTIHTYNPQGIDEIYTIGEWVNIYDIYGRKLTTTNENIYTMSLPRGIYMVVTSNGNTIKILK